MVLFHGASFFSCHARWEFMFYCSKRATVECFDLTFVHSDLHSTSPDRPQLGSFVFCVRLQIVSYQALPKACVTTKIVTTTHHPNTLSCSSTPPHHRSLLCSFACGCMYMYVRICVTAPADVVLRYPSTPPQKSAEEVVRSLGCRCSLT